MNVCEISGKLRTAAAVLALFGASTLAHGASVYVSWDQNSESDLAGYRIYYRAQGWTAPAQLDVGNQNGITVADLLPGVTYHFSATAYNVAGLESDPSAEITYTVPLEGQTGSRVVSIGGSSYEVQGSTGVVYPPMTTSQGVTVRAVGLPSTSYLVQASDTLREGEWVNIGTAMANSQGIIQVQDPQNLGKRFYRVISQD